MLDQQTVNKLRELKLEGMAQEFRRQEETPEYSAMTFEERLGFLVDYEWTCRRNRLVKRLLSTAKLKDVGACLEDMDYTTPRGLDRKLITRLAGPDWIAQHQNVVVTGPTGVGKSFIGCALGNMACRLGYSTRYYRVTRLLTEIAASHGDGTYISKMNNIKKLDLLILDDWGINPFTKKEGSELFEIIEDRSLLKSTVIIGQIPEKDWHSLLPDPTVADAIIDRFIHTAYHIHLTGDTMRRIKAKNLPPQE